MLRKRMWIPLLIVLLPAMGCGLFYGRKVAKQEPVKVYKVPIAVERKETPKPPPPGETAESGHWHGDEWHAEPHSAHAPAEVSEQPQILAEPTERDAVVSETQPTADFVNPTSKSSNPLFADGVPEHLQCPPEWVGVRVDDESVTEELVSIVETMWEEIKEKWNPNRPLPEIWDVAIERQQHLKSEGVSIDVLIQLILDFPEILVLFEEDSPRAMHMVAVETGEKDPDWNVAVLHDGRVFRMKANYKYHVRFTEVMDVETGREAVKSYDLGPPDPSAPIHGQRIINIDEMTDVEIASQGGWNYNINPYTTNVPRRKIPPDFVNPTRASTNPLFADGVPEHLQCPPEIVGIYDIRIENRPFEVDPETFERIHQARREILEKWNPNRPLTEVWPLFIAAEKWYKSNAVPYLAGEGLGQERFDWLVQLTLDFPEIFALFEEDSERAWNMRMIEIGERTPDLNILRLPDDSDRTFRIDNNERYQFTWGTNGVRNTYTIGDIDDQNAEGAVIRINLDTITDEELEALQGWDYNINPYTTGAYKLKNDSRKE
ncbi:MAG: hypothetical protein OXH39_23785 [Candidatus Poribacteria bacterium]|nr:hypothetical protein [Candidatus Poribacteria bacterium]